MLLSSVVFVVLVASLSILSGFSRNARASFSISVCVCDCGSVRCPCFPSFLRFFPCLCSPRGFVLASFRLSLALAISHYVTIPSRPAVFRGGSFVRSFVRSFVLATFQCGFYS